MEDKTMLMHQVTCPTCGVRGWAAKPQGGKCPLCYPKVVAYHYTGKTAGPLEVYDR